MPGRVMQAGGMHGMAGIMGGKHLLWFSTPSPAKDQNISMGFFIPDAAVSGQNHAGKPGGSTHLWSQHSSSPASQVLSEFTSRSHVKYMWSKSCVIPL